MIEDWQLEDMRSWIERTIDDPHEAARAHQATTKGIAAFERLLKLAETSDSAQAGRIARFFFTLFTPYQRFDLFELRTVDASTGDDMLAVLDAHRWGLKNIEGMLPGARDRLKAMLSDWGMYNRGQGRRKVSSRNEHSVS